MSDVTVTTTDLAAATTTTVQNDAIPTTEVATSVDTATPTNTAAPTDAAVPNETITIVVSSDTAVPSPNETTTAPATTPASTPAPTPTFTTSSLSSIAATTFLTSSRSTQLLNGSPFSDYPSSGSGTSVQPPSTTSSTLPSASQDPSNSLNTGAKIGVGVGATAIVLAIVAVIVLMVKSRKTEDVWPADGAPPPTYDESHGSSAIGLDMRSRAAMKQMETPLQSSPGGSYNNLTNVPPGAPRNLHRKSKASMLSRRESNLARVSEEGADGIGTNLAWVGEDDEGRALRGSPSNIRAPRMAALYALTGDANASSHRDPSYPYEHGSLRADGYQSPLNPTKRRSGLGGR